MAERITPAKHRPTSVVSSFANHSSVGAARKRRMEPVRASEFRNDEMGTIPRAPNSPVT